MLKKILFALLVLFILIQFIHPARNEGNDQTYAMYKVYPIPDDVNKSLSLACYDCHSNSTRYPWYFKIQPVAWFMANHIENAKRRLNFSEYTNRRMAFQNHKFEEIMENVEKDMMPLSSYTLIHKDAILTEDQKKSIINWAQSQMDSIKNRYPADSLVMPKRPTGPPLTK